MKTRKQLNSYAQRMRARPTPSELLAHKLLTQAGYRFLSQVVFGFYIIDFVIPSLMLAIEVDGSSHDNKQDYDARRDEFITQLGLKILHIRNQDVANLPLLISNLPRVENFLEIFKECKKQACAIHKQRSAPKPRRTRKKCASPLCRKKKTP